ncbi:MAG: hypothetical protein KDI07_02685 [Anaerolineae bacterium]|nr:hypothetical protein [Anaerolineae bacterium]
MSTKHHLSSAQELYVGAGYDALLFGTNGRKGVPVHLLTRVSLGSPIALDADGLIVGATSTELPNNGTITYTTAEDGASPIDTTPTPSTITTSTGATASVWALDVPRNITATSTSAVADTVFTITGYDYWKVKVVEQFTIAAAASAGAGKKAFAYIESIAIYSAGDITTDTVTVGWGDVLGLPYKLTAKADAVRVFFNDVLDDSATVVKADATDPATATTGDVRGTVDTNSASDGSAVVVWMHVQDTSTPEGLRGVAQYGG